MVKSFSISAIEPGAVLPNGQIADRSTALKETLLAVKDVYEANPGRAGIACAMKNSGVGVGLPDKGRARLVVRNGMVEIYCGAPYSEALKKDLKYIIRCEASLRMCISPRRSSVVQVD